MGKSFLKFFTVSIAALLILTSLQPQTANANEKFYTAEENELLTEVMDIMNELDSKVDLHNLDQNTADTLDTLSPEAYELYNHYQDSVTEAKVKGVQQVINETMEETYGQTVNHENTISPRFLPPLVTETKYNYSNAQVKWVLNKAEEIGVGGLFATAVAKYFKKNPTAHTLMIGAIGASGVILIKRCNSKNKGITISRMRVGASHYFSCSSR